jgi:hypothetical protein
MNDRVGANDDVSNAHARIEVRVGELRQLFNAIDPSPFNERDLDPRAEEFIVEWASDLPRDAPLALIVHLDRGAGRPNEAALLRDALHEFFRQRSVGTRRRLRQLFHRGRISLLIADARLYDRLAAMAVRIVYSGPAGFPAPIDWPNLREDSRRG